jgi:hypothetical protein
MFCQSCGAQVTGLFCTKCGARAGQVAQPPSSASATPAEQYSPSSPPPRYEALTPSAKSGSGLKILLGVLVILAPGSPAIPVAATTLPRHSSEVSMKPPQRKKELKRALKPGIPKPILRIP